jgi:hypothetical protein
MAAAATELAANGMTAPGPMRVEQPGRVPEVPELNAIANYSQESKVVFQ